MINFNAVVFFLIPFIQSVDQTPYYNRRKD